MEPRKDRQAYIDEIREKRVREQLALEKNRKMPRNAPKSERVFAYVVAAGIAVVFIAAIATSLFRPQSTGPDASDWHAKVESACHGSVEQQLKNPASASYSDEEISADGEGSWTMTGTVRAENSFGGTVPSTFTCTATKAGEDSVRATALLVE